MYINYARQRYMRSIRVKNVLHITKSFHILPFSYFSKSTCAKLYLTQALWNLECNLWLSKIRILKLAPPTEYMSNKKFLYTANLNIHQVLKKTWIFNSKHQNFHFGTKSTLCLSKVSTIGT